MKKSMLLALCLSVAVILPGCHGDKETTRTSTKMSRDGKTMKKETTTRRERKERRKDDRNMRDEGKKRTRTYKKETKEMNY